jgi:hypothetical protein
MHVAFGSCLRLQGYSKDQVVATSEMSTLALRPALDYSMKTALVVNKTEQSRKADLPFFLQAQGSDRKTRESQPRQRRSSGMTSTKRCALLAMIYHNDKILETYQSRGKNVPDEIPGTWFLEDRAS